MYLFRKFEKMYFRSSTLHPIVLGTFLETIEEPGAKNAFKSAFDDSTKNKLQSKDPEKIRDIPCLILWGDNDNLIPFDPCAFEFLHDLPKAKLEIIQDSGHAPFVEKTASVYERIRSFIT